jgi:hypothetical protein
VGIAGEELQLWRVVGPVRGLDPECGKDIAYAQVGQLRGLVAQGQAGELLLQGEALALLQLFLGGGGDSAQGQPQGPTETFAEQANALEPLQFAV